MKYFTIKLEDQEVESIQQAFEDLDSPLSEDSAPVFENAITVGILEQILEQTEPVCNIDLGGEG